MDLSRLLVRLAFTFGVSAILAHPANAQLQQPDNMPAPEIASVTFAGVSKDIDLTTLEASIYTESTKCRSLVLAPFCRFTNYRGFEERHYFNRQEFKRDVLRIRVFYYRLGYREAQVDTAITRINEKEIAVTFTIREGVPTIVADVTVKFDSAIVPRKKVDQLTLMRKDTPLNLFEFDSTRVQLQNELWERGYADALIDTSTVVDAESHRARVSIYIVPNRLATVGDIAIGGTEKVAPSTILNSLSFRPGDLFRRSATLESQRTLYESNLFKLAVLEVPQTFDSVKSVNVLVREAPLHEARTSFGFNTVDFLQTEGRYTDYNLFGGARQLALSATVGNIAASTLNGKGLFKRQNPDTSITGSSADFLKPTWQLSAELRQQAFLSRPQNTVAIRAFAQRRAVPAVVIDNGYGGNVSFTHALAIRAPVSVSYRFEETRVEAGGPYFCVNFGVCDTTSIAALRLHQRLSPVTAEVQVDRTDQPLNPSRGYAARAELETASTYTASDYRYNRAYADATVYSRLGGKASVLAAHLKLGFVRPFSSADSSSVLHPRKRFYAGGAQSVRGFGENQLGPRILTLPRAYLLSAKTPTGARCDVTTEAVHLCDPNTVRDSSGNTIGDDKFTPRPLGGTSLLEGSIEYRFPMPFLKDVGGAVFVDGAAVGERVLNPLQGVETLKNLVRGTYAITPGFGVRYYSSVGPIRVDVGFNPSKAEDLAVVTEIVRNGKAEIVPLDTPRRFSPMGSGGGIGGFLNRFTLHLSIGQAY